MARVFVEPIGVTLEVAADEDLLAPLVRAAVDIPTDCAGRGTCGKCLVRLGAGELTPTTERELKRVPEKLRADGWRLACQAHALSARVSIEVRATGGRRRILTASKLQHGASHPAVTTQAVTMDVPTMEDKRSDVARFTQALSAGGIKASAADVPLPVLQRLPQTLRDGRWRAVAARYGRRVVDVFPGESRAGPLRRRRRHRHVEGHRLPVRPGPRPADRPRGRREPADALRRGRDQPHRARGRAAAQLDAAAARRGRGHQHVPRPPVRAPGRRAAPDLRHDRGRQHGHASPGAGAIARRLGRRPVRAGSAEPWRCAPRSSACDMAPDAGVYFPPPIAGFVGADALAVIAATQPGRQERPSWPSTSAPTPRSPWSRRPGDGLGCASGPAFEGYHIQHGMKAVAGAIERVRIRRTAKPSTSRPSTASRPSASAAPASSTCSPVSCAPAWSTRAVGSRTPAGPPRDAGSEYLLATGHRRHRLHPARCADLQLAKGAIPTGWALLLDNLGVAADDLHRVYVAGAFGNYLDLRRAVPRLVPAGADRPRLLRR